MGKCWKNIAELLFFQEGPGVRNTQYTSAGVKLLNVANLVDGKVDLSTSDRYISKEEAYGKYQHFLCDDGDFVVASSGIKVEYIDKKMGFIDASMLPLCMNTSTVRFKVLDPSVLQIRYFMYYLKSQHFKTQLARHITGSAQLNYGPSHIKKMIMPWVDLKEQDEIVEKFDHIQSMIELRGKQLTKLDELVKSRFVEMFGDDKFTKKPIRELVDRKIASARKTYSSDETIHYIDISSIDNKGNVVTGTTEYIMADAPSRAQQCIKYGDILISTVRPNLRNIARNTYNGEGYVASSGFCVLRAKNCDARFLLCAVLTDSFTNAMTEVTTGANYPAIKDSDVLEYRIPVPPIELQEQFAAFVEQTDKSKLAVKQSLEKLETLKKSLMQQYFG